MFFKKVPNILGNFQKKKCIFFHFILHKMKSFTLYIVYNTKIK